MHGRANKRLSALLRSSLLLVVLLGSARSAAQELPSFSCVDYTPPTNVDVLQYAGVWYEVLRLPASDAGICVSLLAPNATTTSSTADDGEYEVTFDYVDNFSDKTQYVPVHEVIAFPWNEQTRNGIFQLDYAAVTIIFKLIVLPLPGTPSMAAVCGYAAVPGTPPLMKLFARDKELSAPLRQQIELLAEAYNVSEYLSWVEQNDCSGGGKVALATIGPLVMFIAVLYSVLQQ